MTPQELSKKNTESGHQKAVMAWAAMACYKGFAHANYEPAYSGHEIIPPVNGRVDITPIRELKWLHAIPNGGARDARTAALMKAEGARRGVYDLMLPVARGGYHGLYIEMKKSGDYVVSPEQKEFGAFVREQGYAALVSVGWEAAVSAIENYIKGACFGVNG